MLATGGTARFLTENGIAAAAVAKVGEGSPHIGQVIRDGGVQMVINTPLGKHEPLRRKRHPARGPGPGHSLHHHPVGRPGGRGRHPGPAAGAGHRDLPPGPPQTNRAWADGFDLNLPISFPAAAGT